MCAYSEGHESSKCSSLSCEYIKKYPSNTHPISYISMCIIYFSIWRWNMVALLEWNNDTGCHCIEGNLYLICKVLLASERTLLPTYHTKHVPVLFRETGLLPLDLEYNSRSRQAILPACKLDPRHTLRKRTISKNKIDRENSCLSRRVLTSP